MTKPIEHFTRTPKRPVADTTLRGFQRRVAGLFACAVLLTVSGCAWFGGSDKKPPALPALTTTNAAALVWSANVGKSAGYLFVPGFGDRLVYAASHAGDVYALSEEGGRTVTRIETKARLAGGVGVGDNLVVVASIKGDVLAFDAAGRALWKANVSGDVLMNRLDNIIVSRGSACNSAKNQGSHVLRGIGADITRPSVRFSFCKYNTKEEVDFTISKLKELFAVKSLANSK